MNHPIHLILSAGTRIVTRNGANHIGAADSCPKTQARSRIANAPETKE
jgi:hypothetical protein